MATDHNFPITLRMSALRTLGIFATGALFLGVSFLMFDAEGTTRVPIFGYVEKHNLAYFFFILGVAITIAMVQAFVTDRPALVLDADGFVYKPVFGAVRRLAWAEVADLTSRSNKYERCVVIRTRTGQTMKIPAFQGSAEYMWYVMESCVAEAKEAHQAKAAPAADRA